MGNIDHEGNDLITTAEAAKLSGWSVTTLNRKAASGDLPVAFKGEGKRGLRLFNRADVERIAKQEHAA